MPTLFVKLDLSESKALRLAQIADILKSLTTYQLYNVFLAKEKRRTDQISPRKP
jgi:hypothetical protein